MSSMKERMKEHLGVIFTGSNAESEISGIQAEYDRLNAQRESKTLRIGICPKCKAEKTIQGDGFPVICPMCGAKIVLLGCKPSYPASETKIATLTIDWHDSEVIKYNRTIYYGATPKRAAEIAAVQFHRKAPVQITYE